MNAPLAAYARHQLADYVVSRALLPLAMIVFIAGFPRLAMSRDMDAAFWSSPQGVALAKQLFQQSVALFLPLGAFFATSGVISADREKGYFRFLFSKPVSVVAFYAQQYVVHGVAFVLLFGALTWAWGLTTVQQSVLSAMAAAALTWVLVGGVGFALGALIRHDGPVLAFLYLAGTASQAIAAAGQGVTPGWLVAVSRVLPPAHALDLTRTALYDGKPLDAALLWLVLGYGAAGWIIGCAALRWRTLQR